MERKDILMKKRIIALVTAFVCMASSVSASVLGSGLVDSSSLLIGRGTSLYKNTFFRAIHQMFSQEKINNHAFAPV